MNSQMSEQQENYIEDFIEEPEEEGDGFETMNNIELQSEEIAKLGKKKGKSRKYTSKI